jgi:murein tripeptide amidase MpaA
MEGFINWLVSSTSDAEALRNSHVFKIIPMANPDGVVIGNYRTGLSGRDFNR